MHVWEPCSKNYFQNYLGNKDVDVVVIIIASVVGILFHVNANPVVVVDVANDVAINLFSVFIDVVEHLRNFL